MGMLSGWFAVGSICVAIAGCSAAAPGSSGSGGEIRTEASPSPLSSGCWSLLPSVHGSPPATSGTDPARAEDTAGQFSLTLELPHTDWKSSDSITGLATISYLGSGEVQVGLSGDVATFSFDELGGCRHMGGVNPADLVIHPISADKPITTPITKTMAMMGGDPNASFCLSWAKDPLLHLPAGDWTITAALDATGPDIDQMPELANLPALKVAVTVHVTN
jgi:hypothetical protein